MSYKSNIYSFKIHKMTDIQDVTNVTDVKNDVDPDKLPNDIDLNVTKEQFKQIIQAIQKSLDGQTLSSTNIIRVVANVMSVSATMKDIPNKTKKKLVIAGLTQYVKSENIPNEIKEILYATINEVCSGAIDVLAELKVGGFKIFCCCC